MPKIVPQRIQTCFDCNLGQFFRKISAQFSMEGRVFEKFQKNQKICKIPKMPKIVPKSIQTCFEHALGQNFQIFFASVPWRLETSKNFKKNQKSSKVPKMPKIVPKSIQTCFELVLGQIFRNFFLPSVPWRVEFSKIFKKKISNFQKCPKVFPNVSKRVLNMFLGKFFEKFLPSFPWNIESPKIFEKKMISKFQKAQKCSQKYPNVFYGDFFEKNLCPVFHGGSSFRKFSIFFLSKFQKRPKSFPKESKRVLIVIWDNFFEKFLPSFPWKVESSKIFKKIKKSFKFPKMPKIVPKSIQMCFERVLGQTFRKISAQFSMEGRVFEKFQKKSKILQNSKKAQNRSQKYPNVF